MDGHFNESFENNRYRGMNPAFVQRVWAKRREAQAQAAPRKPTIGEVLAERMAQRAAKAEAERVRKLRAMVEAGGARAIIAEAALQHGVSVEDIVGQGRSKPLIAARHQAVVEVATRNPAMSMPQIGRLFRRDHTTILAVFRKFSLRGHKPEDRAGRTLREAR